MGRKSRFRDRKDYGKQLQERTEAASGARGGKWKPIFRTDVKFNRWVCKEGDHVIDIIPYIDSDNNIRYKLEVLVHQRIGPDEGNYICPKTFDSSANCALCELRAVAQADDAEVLAELLRPRDRVIYNMVCYDSDKEEDKDVQVWEASSFLAEDNFQAAAKQRKKGGVSKKVSFADPDDGRTISFERTGTGVKTKYVGFTMDERDEPISDEILDMAHILEDLIDVPTQKALEEQAAIVSGMAKSDPTPDPDPDKKGSSKTERVSRMERRGKEKAKELDEEVPFKEADPEDGEEKPPESDKTSRSSRRLTRRRPGRS